MILTKKEKNIIKNLRHPIVGTEIKTRSETISELENEELLSLFNKMDSYIEEEGEVRRSLGLYDEMYIIELLAIKDTLNSEYEKRNKVFKPISSRNLMERAMKGEDISKYWCNNWRRRNKHPMRRKGSSLVNIEMKFEHKTTKKQKKRWSKKHTFNPLDIEIK